MKFEIGQRVVLCDTVVTNEKQGYIAKLGIVLNVSSTRVLLNVFDFRKQNFEGIVKFDVLDNVVHPIEELETIRGNLTAFYNDLINTEALKLASVTSEMKEQELRERYLRIKHDILANCKVMLETDIDDDDFLNRLSELQKLRNQLYRPNSGLECVSKIRKQNGTVKYNIRELKIERDKVLREIDEDALACFNNRLSME